MFVEGHFRWIVTKKNKQYFGALPRPFVDGLMQFSPSTIPIVRAINTAPLVSMSGDVVAGVGLDRRTGLFHRIDPLLQACIPANPPTEQDVQDALVFLCDEWLVDVALDPVGKAVGIMLAMTLIERTLLPERPAFFITAAQRGGGKTTLANMITLAVLGRRAAAAAWSHNAEERKKALFSYLRQGVACLVWDNISRGSAIVLSPYFSTKSRYAKMLWVTVRDGSMAHEWGVSILRLSLFSGDQLQLSDEDWKIVTGEEEAPVRQTVAGLRRLSGKAFGGAMTLGAAAGRVDFVLGVDESSVEENENLKLPIMANWDTTVNQFCRATIPWIEASLSGFNRMALGAVLLKESQSVESAYSELNELLNSVDVDKSRMRDLLYRVNWPRESKTIPGLTINRITTWSVLRLVRKLLAMTGSELTPAKGEDFLHAIRLEIDHNTAEARTEPFDRKELIHTYEELASLATENVKKGELS